MTTDPFIHPDHRSQTRVSIYPRSQTISPISIPDTRVRVTGHRSGSGSQTRVTWLSIHPDPLPLTLDLGSYQLTTLKVIKR